MSLSLSLSSRRIPEAASYLYSARPHPHPAPLALISTNVNNETVTATATVPRALPLQRSTSMCVTSNPLPPSPGPVLGNKRAVASVPMRRSFASMGVAGHPLSAPPMTPMSSMSSMSSTSSASSTPSSASMARGGYVMERTPSSLGVDGNPFAPRTLPVAATSPPPPPPPAALPQMSTPLGPLPLSPNKIVHRHSLLDLPDRCAPSSYEVSPPRPICRNAAGPRVARFTHPIRVPARIRTGPAGPSPAYFPYLTAASYPADNSMHTCRHMGPHILMHRYRDGGQGV